MQTANAISTTFDTASMADTAEDAMSLPDSGRQTRFLELAGGRIAYDDTGKGPLVVLVPGLGDLRQSYRTLAPVLAGAGYRVARMDLRGHGESSVGWPAYGNADLGRDVLALVKHLEQARPSSSARRWGPGPRRGPPPNSPTRSPAWS